MPPVKAHGHPCQFCGARVECSGTWLENYDGEPPVICDAYHLPGGALAEVICDDCEDARVGAEQEGTR